MIHSIDSLYDFLTKFSFIEDNQSEQFQIAKDALSNTIEKMNSELDNITASMKIQNGKFTEELSTMKNLIAAFDTQLRSNIVQVNENANSLKRALETENEKLGEQLGKLKCIINEMLNA